MKKDYKCTIGECPYCLAIATTHHSKKCPLFVGFDDDSLIADIINYWQSEQNEDDIILQNEHERNI